MKIIIVGCGGIGAFLAESLAKAGNEVFCISRNILKNKALSEAKVWRFDADVTSADQMKKSFDYITNLLNANWKYADALIYAAGSQGQIDGIDELDPDEMLRTYDVNVVGFIRSWQVFRGLLNKSPKRAKIITFGGGGADKARVNFSDYAATKAASVRLVEILADELNVPGGIRCNVNIVAPGMIKSGMTKKVIEAGPFTGSEFEKAVALKEDPAVLAKLLDCVQFLLSPESDGISGKFIAAQWDDYKNRETYAKRDAYQLRRIVPDEPVKK